MLRIGYFPPSCSLSGFILYSGVFRASVLWDSAFSVKFSWRCSLFLSLKLRTLLWTRLFKAVYSRWHSCSELPLKLSLVPKKIIRNIYFMSWKSHIENLLWDFFVNSFALSLFKSSGCILNHAIFFTLVCCLVFMRKIFPFWWKIFLLAFQNWQVQAGLKSTVVILCCFFCFFFLCRNTELLCLFSCYRFMTHLSVKCFAT